MSDTETITPKVAAEPDQGGGEPGVMRQIFNSAVNTPGLLMGNAAQAIVRTMTGVPAMLADYLPDSSRGGVTGVPEGVGRAARRAAAGDVSPLPEPVNLPLEYYKGLSGIYERMTPQPANFYDEVVGGIGSMGGYMAGGALLGGPAGVFASGVGAVAPKLAKTVTGFGGGFIEGSGESADVYFKNRDRGVGKDEAMGNALKTLAINIVLDPVTNYLGFVAENKYTKGAFKRVLNASGFTKRFGEAAAEIIASSLSQGGSGAFTEFAQETTQGLTSQRYGDGRSWGDVLSAENIKNTMRGEGLVGGVVGGITGGAFGASGAGVHADASAADIFMDGVLNDIENGAPQAPQAGAEAANVSEVGTDIPSRKFVPNTGLLSEVVNSYRDVMDIPESKRSQEDRVDLAAYMDIFNLYASGQPKEAEALALELRDNGAGGKPKAAIPTQQEVPPAKYLTLEPQQGNAGRAAAPDVRLNGVQDEGAEIVYDEILRILNGTDTAPKYAETAVPATRRNRERAEPSISVRAAPPADGDMEIFARVRERFVKDLRRLNAADPESLNADDRRKSAMLSLAANAYQKGDFSRTAEVLTKLYGGESSRSQVKSAPIAAKERATSELAVPARKIDARHAYVGTPRAVHGGYQIEKTDGSKAYVPEAIFGDYYQVTPRERPVPESKRVVNGYAAGDVFQSADGGAYWVTKVGTKGVTLTDGAGKSRTVSLGTMAKSNLVRLSPEHRGDTHYSLVPGYSRAPLYGVGGEEVGARFADTRQETTAEGNRSYYGGNIAEPSEKDGAFVKSPEPVVGGPVANENMQEGPGIPDAKEAASESVEGVAYPGGEYKYYLNARPAGPGAVPKGITRIDNEDKGGRHGAVYYDHELSAKDVSDYELVPAKENSINQKNDEPVRNEKVVNENERAADANERLVEGDVRPAVGRSEVAITKKNPGRRISEKQRTAAGKRVQARAKKASKMQGYHTDEAGRQVFTDTRALFRLSKPVEGLEPADVNAVWPARVTRFLDNVKKEDSVILGKEEIAEIIERGKNTKGKSIAAVPASITKVGHSYVDSAQLGDVLSTLGAEEVTAYTSKPEPGEHKGKHYSNVYFTSKNGEALLSPINLKDTEATAVDDYYKDAAMPGRRGYKAAESSGGETGADKTAGARKADKGNDKKLLDKEYLSAVEAGDMDTAQKMVDEAAKEAGFLPLYHGTTKNGYAKIMEDGKLRAKGEYAVYLTTSSDFEGYGDGTVVRLAVQENRIELDDEFPSGRQDYRIETDKSRSVQVKSMDPVTYDDAGKAIPLSKRFNRAKADIRYRLADKEQVQASGAVSDAETRLRRDSEAWANTLDKFAKEKVKQNSSVRVMDVPVVLQVLDLKNYSENGAANVKHPENIRDGEIRTTISVLNKVVYGSHIGSITRDMAKQIPEKIAKPVMVLHSSPDSRNPNSIVTVVQLADKQGAPVIASIALSPHSYKDGVYYTLTSMYGKTLNERSPIPNPAWVQKQIDKGRLLYVDEAQIPVWEKSNSFKLTLPEIKNNASARGGLGPIPKSLVQGQERYNHNIATLDDVVNAQKNVPGAYALGMKRAGLPPLSVADVAARVKGATVSGIDDGKMKLEFSNGTAWIVDAQAEAIAADPEIAARDYGRELRPGESVVGRTRVIDGQRFIDLVAGMSDAKTFSHEVFESAWDSLTTEEQGVVLKTHGSRENAAERYGEFLEGRIGKLTKRTQAIFQRVKDFFSAIRASLFGKNSEDIFREVATGKMWRREAGAREDSEHYRLGVRRNADADGDSRSEVQKAEMTDVDEKTGEVTRNIHRPEAQFSAAEQQRELSGNEQWQKDLAGTGLESVVSTRSRKKPLWERMKPHDGWWDDFSTDWRDDLHPLLKHFGEKFHMKATN
ncbi:MAG: hypothetical protein Q4C86_14130, partial [bacterium]|nr:hypothetical protein [bacterium]